MPDALPSGGSVVLVDGGLASRFEHLELTMALLRGFLDELR